MNNQNQQTVTLLPVLAHVQSNLGEDLSLDQMSKKAALKFIGQRALTQIMH